MSSQKKITKFNMAHHGSQRAGTRAVGQGSDNVPAKQGNICPRQPLGFQGGITM